MVTSAEFDSYRAQKLAAIKDLLDGTGARPVLFLGCGITKRYVGGPSWMELLEAIATRSGIDRNHFQFLSQKVGNSPAQLGSALVDPVHEWAWGAGRNMFPPEYFSVEVEKSIFLKCLAADHLKAFQLDVSDPHLVAELELLKAASPHAVITTNFDGLIESIYPEFELVVGERIIPMSMNIMGELYKIHGTISDPSTLVLTAEDYERFGRKRRYITSKMMTYFAEYPVFILGYGLGDSNVNAIIGDLGEAMKDVGGVIDNVFYVEWVQDIAEVSHLKDEHLIPNDAGGPPLRVRTIVTTDFDWLLRALADFASPMGVNTKVLRHLAARVIELVRTDVPRNTVELDFKKIENLTLDPTELALVLGIGNVTNANMDYPYLLSQVAKMLGYKYWSKAHYLIIAANEKYGLNIKGSDNEYHWAFKSGTNSVTHKYSNALVKLLDNMRTEMAAADSTVA